MINASLARVFSVLDNPDNLSLLYYCVFDVSNPAFTDTRVGKRFRGTFSMIGIQFDVDFTYTEHAPLSRITLRFEGGAKGKMSFFLEPERDLTRITIEVEYELSKGLLARIANRLLFEQMGAKNTERILENLSLLVDAAVPPVQPLG